MPTESEMRPNLKTDEDYRKAVSECIQKLRNEGRTQEEAAAICYSIAERASGKSYPKKGE